MSVPYFGALNGAAINKAGAFYGAINRAGAFNGAVTDLDTESSFQQTSAYGCCDSGVNTAFLLAFLAGE